MSQNHSTDHHETNENTHSSPNTRAATKSKRKKFWRWSRRLVVLFLLIIVAVVAAVPWFLSTDSGRKLAVSIINGQMEGRVALDDLDLSWRNQSQVTGVKVWDAQNRLVLQLPSVRLSKGLWSLLVSRQQLGQINLEEPRAVVYMVESASEPSGDHSVKESAGATEIPALQADIHLQQGQVRFVHADGRSYEITGIDGQLSLDVLNEIKGNLQLDLMGGGRVQGRVDVSQLVSGGKIQPDAAIGNLELSSSDEVDMGPLLAFLQEESNVGGRLAFNITAHARDGEASADWSARIEELHIASADASGIKPIDLDLTGRLQADAEKLTVESEIGSQAGKIHMTLVHQQSGQPLPLNGDQLVSAILQGTSVVLPDFTLNVDGAMDVPTLAAAVPAILKIQPDIRITQGQIQINEISLRGGNDPALSGSLQLANLVAQKGDRTITCEPVQARFDLGLEPGTGLVIRQAKLNSAFAQLTAGGPPSHITGSLQTDLNRLQEQLNLFFEIEPVTLAGNVTGTFDVIQAADNKIDVSMQVIGNHLRYQKNHRQEPPSGDKRQDISLDRLELTTRFHHAGNDAVYTLQGEGVFKNLDIDGKRLTDRDISLTWQNLQVAPDRQVITLGQTQLTSEFLQVVLSGTITDYQSECKLALNGHYEGSWERITVLLHQLAPDTTDTIAFAGATRSDFVITGPLRKPTVSPVYRGIDATAQLAWNSGEVYGIVMNGATLSPKIKEGQVSLGSDSIGCGDGKINLAGLSVDLQGDEPLFKTVGKIQVLQEVPINAKVGQYLLSRINPVFTDIAAMEGKLSLELENVNLPLSQRIKTSGAGRAHLDLSQMKVSPRGLLADLLEMGGIPKEKIQNMQVGGVDLFVKDGRIKYDHFLVRFSDSFDLMFSGSVGFDDSLDLTVSVPVRAALLRQFGVRGSAADYVRLLSDARVDIPLVGTRQKPRLDLKGVDIQPLLNKAADQLLEEKSKDALNKILGITGQKKEDRSKNDAPDEKKSPDDLENQLHDILKDVLGEEKKQK